MNTPCLVPHKNKKNIYSWKQPEAITQSMGVAACL